MTELQMTIEPALLVHVSRKYHYMEQDFQTLCQVAEQMNRALRGQCGFWLSESVPLAFDVVMTLGAGIDRLQEEYTAQGSFVECYMTECIADEFLLACYRAFNEWVAAHTDHFVKRYEFCRDGAGFSLQQIPKVLSASACDLVTCNPAYCLSPRKSVVFRAELTQDKDTVCEGICVGCGREYCANRIPQR